MNIRTHDFPTSWDEVPIVIDLEYVSCYILQYTVQTLKLFSREKRFPAFKVGTGWRVKKDDLLDWIEKQKAS